MDSDDARPDDELTAPRAAPAEIAPKADEPPVVARLVVEIRSDGSTTIARGSLEDAAEGVRVGIEARGATPLEVATSLVRSVFELPSMLRSRAGLAPRLVRGAVRALLPGRQIKGR